MSAASLPDRMRARADADALPKDHDLRVLADRLDDASAGFFDGSERVTVEQMVGAWARARRAWSTYTGEPLI